jgi:TRAP-type C4-dicarboxylate transport system permease small subunit
MLINGFLWIERVTTRGALIGAVVALALAVSLAFYQVIVRFVFESPSTWSAAATRTLVIWSVFLGAAHAFRSDSMMRVELIYTALPTRWHRWVETLVTVLCLVFFVVLAWFGYKMGVRVSRQVLSGLNISIAWAYAALPVGSVFVIVALVARYLERVVRGVPPESVAAPPLADDQRRTRP